MVDLVDRAQELEEWQRQDALRRVRDRARRAPAAGNPEPTQEQPTTENDDR